MAEPTTGSTLVGLFWLVLAVLFVGWLIRIGLHLYDPCQFPYGPVSGDWACLKRTRGY